MPHTKLKYRALAEANDRARDTVARAAAVVRRRLLAGWMKTSSAAPG